MTGAGQEETSASVIVPHFDQKSLLMLCLKSLEAQTLARGRYEIIVADNGTPGGVADIAARFPDVKFISVRERGAASARNGAMAIARGHAFAFTDADCIVAPDWLEQGLKALAEADLVGGRIDVTVVDRAHPSPIESFEKVFAFRQRDYVTRKQFAATANLFASRRAADAIGPFTNGLSEDVDWCRRGVALGFHLAFNDKAIIRHPARREWSELVRKWDRIISERWNGVSRLERNARRRWAAIAAATALSPAFHALKVIASPRLSGIGERCAALAVLARIRWWRARRMFTLLR